MNLKYDKYREPIRLLIDIATEDSPAFGRRSPLRRDEDGEAK